MKQLHCSLLGALAALAASALLFVPAQAQTSGSIGVGSARIAYRAALSRRYTVVTPDLRGFGSSTTPDTKGGVELYAKDMFAVMDHLKVRKAIIGGMSMGGPVVLEMYREAPQRFRGMILIDSTSFPATIAEQGLWSGFGKQAREKGIASQIPILMPDMLTTRTRITNPALVGFVSGTIKRASVNDAVAGAQTLIERPDSRQTLAHVTVPILIVEGLETTRSTPSRCKSQ